MSAGSDPEKRGRAADGRSIGATIAQPGEWV